MHTPPGPAAAAEAMSKREWQLVACSASEVHSRERLARRSKTPTLRHRLLQMPYGSESRKLKVRLHNRSRAGRCSPRAWLGGSPP